MKLYQSFAFPALIAANSDGCYSKCLETFTHGMNECQVRQKSVSMSEFNY